jgi:hypothetical protein
MLKMQIIKQYGTGFIYTGKRIKKMKPRVFVVFKELHTHPQ